MRGSFGEAVARADRAGRLVVQPRLGFSDPAEMRAALLAVKQAAASTVGTITLDSFTRVGDDAAARRAIVSRSALNGYPIVAHPLETTRRFLLDGVLDVDFPVQVRHGSAAPAAIFAVLAELGLWASEGGPVSYCLPYSRRPLADSIAEWATTTERFAEASGGGRLAHLETFGGCMLGQLCPPSLLVALSVLEALFFRQHGIVSVSLSYAQQTNRAQDVEAVRALRRLAGELLGPDDWHVVIYTYMGLFPRTAMGAAAVLRDSVRLARATGSARLIVKTAAEAHRIPQVWQNIVALELAAEEAAQTPPPEPVTEDDSETYVEARALVDSVLDLDQRVGRALRLAFARGLLDVPYCLHPDNANRARGIIGDDGRLRWSDVGAMRVPAAGRTVGTLSSSGLLQALEWTARRYDQLDARGGRGQVRAGGDGPVPVT
ncbi:methylaspartate mutase [Micromonospora sp. NPDC005299]|uniref:methylaspartate mutase n=1 Tax=Micromonospora sp. NPDC005299 TaxID=3364231 RepID=UPI0036D09B2C